MSNNKKRVDRYSKWTFITYPNDSEPINYKDIINNYHVAFLSSPIHDKDLNGDDTEKKPHRHNIIDFGKAKYSFEEVKEFIKDLNGTIPKHVKSEKALVRYFIHLDNPEKKQYNIMDIVSYGGYEYLDFFTSKADEQHNYYCVEQYIKKYKIDNLINLMDYLDETQEYDLMYFVRTHTFYVNSYLNAMYQLNIRQKNK